MSKPSNVTPIVTPVPKDKILSLLGVECPTRGEGGRLTTQFLASKQPATILQFPNRKERDRVAAVIGAYVNNNGEKVWVKRLKSCDGGDLLLINLNRSSADVKRLYETRPRMGRKRIAA